MRPRSRLTAGIALLVSFSVSSLGFAAQETPSGRTAVLTIAVPETMAYLLSYWVVELKRHYPDVAAGIELADAASVPRAMLEGRAAVGAMTRRMSEEEVRALRERHGQPPAEFRVALDAVAVYVHRDNPLRGITVPQLDAVFSTTRACGYSRNIFWWDELGVDDPHWRIRQIELYGRDARSGAREVFAERALCGGTYKATLEMAPDAAGLLRLVASNPAAIAYAGASGKTHGARALPLADSAGAPYVAPTAENLRAGRYPLTRFLYLYVSKKPGVPLTAAEAALLRLALSPAGQSFADMNGFVSLMPVLVAVELGKLNQIVAGRAAKSAENVSAEVRARTGP